MSANNFEKTVLFALFACLWTACDDHPGATMDGGFDGGSDTDTDADSDGDSDSDVDAGEDAGVPMTPGDYDDPTPLSWALLDGGTFMQGSESSLSPASYSETPAHNVVLSSFEIMTTEVTTSQYAQCVLADVCAEPLVAYGDGSAKNCNWLVWGRIDHPVNCLNVDEAGTFCAWLGARLPSESEWEYAARSGGQDNEYPWGEEEPSCDYAIMSAGDYQYGCGLGCTWPVCSTVAGNTEQGLCDMAGNVKEWMADCWYGDYYGAPTDGSAWAAGTCEDNVLRSGDYRGSATGCRTRIRFYNPSFGRGDYMGFRCARNVE
jgi:formylglycine-generating enzyme required for sulfatase activity